MCDARDCPEDSTCVVELKGPMVTGGRLELDLCDQHTKPVRDAMAALLHGAYSPPPLSRRCVLVVKHDGDHVFPTRKPILDRMQDGEFRGRTLQVPGVSVPIAGHPRCQIHRSEAPAAAWE